MTDLKQNIPELRFPEFEGEWEEKKLSDLGSYSKSYSFSRDVEGVGKVHHIHYGDIHSKLPSKISDINLLPTIKESKDFEFLQKGDIIFADASEDYKDLGKAIMVDIDEDNIIAGLHTHVFRPNLQAVSEFLMYYTKTLNYFKFIKRQGTGISVLGISKKNLSNFILGLPEYKEQQRIGDFFSKLDRQIELEEQKLALLEEQKKGYMQKIFSQELRFKDENGYDYPKWEIKLFKDFTNTYSGGTPKSTNQAFYKGDIPFIRSGEIQNSETELHINEDAITNSSAKLVEKGDLLYALYGATSGEVAISKIKGAINQAVLCIKTEESKSFLLNYLKYKKENIIKTYIQGGQGNLSARIIKNMSLKLPSFEEQQKIGDFFSKLDRHIELQGQKIENLKQRKQGLLQKMFV
ncbi:hypothetical protein B4W72_09275 [Staphylococcus delphini]|uniref:restriction endonuclease subunit S n=1 Tax=Staphylococcus delphini TaxID=53344 RepID=UPI000BBC2862|nr:restriction endonuclease subunit S [Staphylococcus delphini]PCF72062.1 hypothetical protein B4W72_09275 [Staphylococcus delphini]HEC2158963.1 restriction endonuclease subunit S [Staphylococcus delphini]